MEKITIKTILVEVFSVVFAVLLALGLNNWWKERSNEKLGEEALSNIVAEIKSNLVELDTSIVGLQTDLDSLLIVKDLFEKGADSASYTLGYSQAVLSDNAWNTANITQAVLYIDPEIIMDMSDLYTVQDVYTDFGMNYFKLFSSLDFNRKENEKTVLNSNIRQIQMSIGFAGQLKQGYEDFLEDHKESLPED